MNGSPDVLMEARDSSFYELRDGGMSPHASGAARASESRSKSRSKSRLTPGRASQSRASRATTIYNEQDANAMILSANAPPNYSGGFNAIMKQIKAKKFYTEQFQRIQMQTEMSRFLFFSDRAPNFYESNYLAFAQSTSVFRVRVCFLLGLVGLTAFWVSEWRADKWAPSASVGRTKSDETAIMALTFGVCLPVQLLGLLATFTPFGKTHLENLTAVVFSVVAAVMIAKKPVEKERGPVIPLLILLIPIFGITRMRYVKSCCIGWGIFFGYLVTMMAVRARLPLPETFDDYTNISYQSINYGISVIGGMVSQYRQELLRRRNFCLQLPFSGTMDSGAVDELHAPKFSKRALMHAWSLKFRHPEVEECFYRFWYLIDPFPYDNPNSGSLHTGVFRTIRFAIWTLLLNQFVLLLQDIKFLKVKADQFVDAHDFDYAMVLRFGVTVPLYISAAGFMYVVGRAFYARWVKEAEDAKNAALMHDANVSVDVADAKEGAAAMLVPNDAAAHSGASTETGDALQTASDKKQAKLRLVVEAATVKAKTRDRVLDVLISKGGYVRSTQIFSSVVIACHVCCMGILLLVVSTGAKADAYEEMGRAPGKPKPVYYMGFLNAVLFAHRSGFRVRFVYATYTTFAVAVGIVAAASSLSPDYYLEYLGYVLVIFVLGMMISYEEESLRRSFFVLKSIRTLEFEEWFAVVLRIQGWVKDHIRKRLLKLRSKGSSGETDAEAAARLASQPPAASPPLVNTSAQMAQASKLGMYSQIFNIAIALADVITSSL